MFDWISLAYVMAGAVGGALAMRIRAGKPVVDRNGPILDAVRKVLLDLFPEKAAPPAQPAPAQPAPAEPQPPPVADVLAEFIHRLLDMIEKRQEKPQ